MDLLAKLAPQPATPLLSAMPYSPEGLRVSSFFSEAAQEALRPLFDTATCLQMITQTPEFSDETRTYLLECVDTALGGVAPGEPATGITLPALVLAHSKIDPQWGQRLLQAARRDVARPTCASWSDLMLYCRYAAEPLGRAVLQHHGLSDPEIERSTDALCASLLVLRLLRRMGTDWRVHGRCYLPTDWIEEAGGSPEQLVEKRLSPALKAALTQALERTTHLLAQARPLPNLLTHAGLRAEAVRLLTHADYQMGQLKRHDPLARRLTTPLWRRALAHLRGYWLAKRAA